MAKTEDMTEKAHKSKKEPKEEVVNTLNEAEGKRGEKKLMRINTKTKMKFLKMWSKVGIK